MDSLQAYWVPKIVQTRGQIPMVFLSNKSDLESEKKFSLGDLEDTVMRVGFDNKPVCYETSARTGCNIDAAFHTLAGALIGRMSSGSEGIPIQEIIRNSEAKSLAGVVDFIIADFADQYGGIEVATPIVKHQMAVAGLDLSNPTLASVTKFIDCMANVEKTFKPAPDVSSNKQTRLQKLSDL
jgi:hypothetical protein